METRLPQRRPFLPLLIGLVFLACSGSAGRWDASRNMNPAAGLAAHAQGAGARRVYVPYDVSANEAVIFWFGRVTLGENYTDVRIRYSNDSLLLTLGIIDRLLWYDTTPSPAELTEWDSVSLYLNRYGNVGQIPNADSYRFDAQLNWGWEPNRTDFQAAYRGDGSQWIVASLPFTTSAGWNGNAPNDNTDDRGWMLYCAIPFTSLGLDSPPVQGTLWGLGVAVHDRDSEEGLPLADQVWPEAMDPLRPATWGQLVFGLKPSYVPDPAWLGATVTIRHGLNGAEVIDADVGGSSICGDPAGPSFFPTWGNLKYPGKQFLNIQHVDPISEWPCFSKYYVTFPLDNVPEGKVILSATLTLYQFGNAGAGHNPQPSLIQVSTVAEDWNESTLTWNNAPLALENVASAWADVFPSQPGEPREWDVSEAVAEAYAASTPLRLALYEADWDYHSGKYFWSSDIDEWSAAMRPTLDVTWGYVSADVSKVAVPTFGYLGDTITYTLNLFSAGNPITLTDTLPAGTSAPGSFALHGTSTIPTYDSGLHRLIWSDALAEGQAVTISYTVTINTADRRALINVAELKEEGGTFYTDSAIVIANPYQVYLPLVSKGD
ncbi:MAG: DUF11 domain-containing protein [Anaerolineae bacterium]|nr:DUF11 domain-containing protein [Anaerolineae bacterium]